MPSTRATVKRSKDIAVLCNKIFLMRSFTFSKSYMLQKEFKISTRSSHTGFTAAPHGIPNVLEDSWHVSHINSDATEMRETISSTESMGPRTPKSTFYPIRRSPGMMGPAI
ncbi:hypothetical protein AVEN_125045-1 [Araneus ventricosus]|uniref:Uncharacterized protein n=1 Tax=Araneus ventricosus TaxID=182803 RepID=A0A4Y2TSQ9_ARAVE|nr:hypothetical protein AVEN_125045-1 [Araneus ventricosus]